VPVTTEFSRCVFASSNRGKLREIGEILTPIGISIVAQSELGIEGAEESGETFVANALIKARHAAKLSGLPAMADDSGLVVDALGGRPGVHSARYAGPDATDEQNITKLLVELRDVPEQQRQAYFHSAVVLVFPNDCVDPIIAEGSWFGAILRTRTGDGGFGYDPVFLDRATGKAAAQMTPHEKNAVSHRGKALRLLAAAMTSLRT
jgi:XTP/dITP diphosphohydrolase